MNKTKKTPTLKVIRSAPKTYKAIWGGVKVATVHYVPSAKFCYRIKYVNGNVGFGCSMAFVECIIRTVATRGDLVAPAPAQSEC